MENSKQDIAINDKLSKDGTKAMTGRLDMKGYEIINLRRFSNTTFEEGDAINYHVFQRERLNARNIVDKGQLLDGTKSMTGMLDMGGKEIINMIPFVEDDDKAG